MNDKIYIHIGPHLGLMVANNTPTFAPNEEEYLRKTPILDWVRGLFQNLDDADRKEALGFFPELAELDDERVGRLLYCIVRGNTAVKAVLEANGVAVDRALEYLESHKGKNYVHENPMTAKFHKPEDGVKYDMYFEDAQAYIEKRGFDVPWNDGDVFVDKDYLVQTVANIIRWADEHPKEQKPAEWNDTDMREARDNLISVCRDWERGERTALTPIVANRARYFLEHLTEPKSAEWREGLEEEIDRYCESIQAWQVQEAPFTSLGDCARHFAQWQKEKFMKGSVEAVFLNTPYPTICLDDCEDYNFKDGDKFRIIIVKED